MPNRTELGSNEYLRVLLVDDAKMDQDILKGYVKDVLDELGRPAKIRVVSNLASAKTALKDKTHWHLMVTDIALGNEPYTKAGLDLARLAREKRVPCIAVSASKKVDKKDVNILANQYRAKFFEKKRGEFYEEFTHAVKEILKRSIRPRRRSKIIRVRPLFQISDTVDDKKAFIIMPFEKPWSDRIWKKMLKPTCRNLGMEAVRADGLYGQNVMEDVWRGLATARIIIADITGRNPNVFYELGIAHTLGKEVILLTQNEKDIPFDLKGFRHIIYEDNLDGYKKLRQELRTSFEHIL